jgi:acyl-CoA oxidase
VRKPNTSLRLPNDLPACTSPPHQVRPFDMIGQRLYTGRIAVGQAALEYRRQLFAQTKEYSDNKRTFAFDGEPVLSEIPQLEAIYQENEEKLAVLDKFVGDCEAALADCLRKDEPPSSQLVDAIATVKVKCVEESIDMCHRLKQEVGSFALMADSGFSTMDFLNCCKFAEGDSRILMSKLARDRIKAFSKDAKAGNPEEIALCKQLVAGMGEAVKGGKTQQQAWDGEWRTVYNLAEAVMARVQKEGV